MRRHWQNWGIAARLLAIVVLPASLMFTAVSATLYLTTLSDVRRDVAERGRIVATALAQSSQYGLVSGNVDYLKLTLRDLLQADPSISCIDIRDAQGHAIVSDCRAAMPREHTRHSLPILLAPTPEVDLLDPMAEASPAQASAPKTIGRVDVAVSPTPILQARKQALLMAFALVLAAALVSCFVGLKLARRLRETMAAVMSALRAIRQGRFDVRLDPDQAGELGELQRTIVQMADTLHAARHDLEQQVATRTRELQEAVDRVRQADAEKRRLIVHSNAAVEDERKRIAVDIHDHLGAALISVRLEASALAARARTVGDPEMEADARRIASTAEGIYATTRNIVKHLRPEIIDTLGLKGAIEELVRNANLLRTGCHFDFSTVASLPHLRPEIAMPAYRITQEAINNIVKHAQASEAEVRLTLGPDSRHLHIEIHDNGQGFDVHAPAHAGLGLIGMRERAVSVGGQLTVQSSPGAGTRLRLVLPITPQAPLAAVTPVAPH